MRNVARWIGTALAFLSFGAATGRSAQPAPSFTVTGPTVIAFCPLTSRELKSQDNAEAFDDYVEYTERAIPRFKAKGVAVQQTTAATFTVRIRGAVMQFANPRHDCGYYFVAPGREPHIERGVTVDDDLMDIAKHYFEAPEGRARRESTPTPPA